MIILANINYITADNKLVKQLSSEIINYKIFYRLVHVNKLDTIDYVKLLLAIHDMEIFSLVPDSAHFMVYIDINDNQLIHSYFYHNYLFSTNSTQEESNTWQHCASIIMPNEILLKMINNMRYPYTVKEKLWVFNTLNNKKSSKEVKIALKNMLNQLTITQYNKLLSDIALLRLSI